MSMIMKRKTYSSFNQIFFPDVGLHGWGVHPRYSRSLYQRYTVHEKVVVFQVFKALLRAFSRGKNQVDNVGNVNKEFGADFRTVVQQRGTHRVYSQARWRGGKK